MEIDPKEGLQLFDLSSQKVQNTARGKNSVILKIFKVKYQPTFTFSKLGEYFF